MPPEASVVIPHHNDVDALDRCLASLSSSSDRDRVEVIVIDNGQATLDASFRARHPDVRFLHEPRKGAAHARNTGVRHARGHLLIFTDSDCTVASDFLTQALTHRPQADVVGGAVRLTSTSISGSNSIEAFEQVFAFNQRHYIEQKGFSVTANLVTNRDVFKCVGPFRDGVSEDYDWCHRATALGFHLTYDPDLVVEHPSRVTWMQLRSKWQRITAETYRLHRTRGGAQAAWLARAAAMPVSIVLHAPRVLVATTLTKPSERVGAMLVLARLRLWRMAEMLRLTLLHDPAETE